MERLVCHKVFACHWCHGLVSERFHYLVNGLSLNHSGENDNYLITDTLKLFEECSMADEESIIIKIIEF